MSSVLGVLSSLCVAVGFILGYRAYRAAGLELERLRREALEARDAGRSIDPGPNPADYLDVLLLKPNIRLMVLRELAPTFGWPFVWVSAGVLLEVAGSIAGLVAR
jgi:hypothetical protein